MTQKERLTKELEQLEKTYKAGIINEREFQKGKDRIDSKLENLEAEEQKQEESKKIVQEILDEPKPEPVKPAPKKEVSKPAPVKPAPKKKSPKKAPAKKKVVHEDIEDDDDDSTFSKVIIFAGIVCILLLLVLVRVFNENGNGGQDLNGVNETIDIVSYMEFSCTHAQEHWDNLLELKEIYGDNVMVRVKHFPQSLESLEVENAIQCARDQGGHISYIERLLDNKDNLDIDALKNYAWAEGLDVIEFHDCIDSREFESRVKNDLEEGLGLGVSGTPTTYVGTEIVDGAQGLEFFKSVVDEQLGIN